MPVAYSDVAGSSSRSARARTVWCFRSAGSTGRAQQDGSRSPTTSTGSTPGIARSSQDRALPFMREVGRFYEDFLIEGPDGSLMFAPSLSPENSPPATHGSMAMVNATMDVAIAREVLMQPRRREQGRRRGPRQPVGRRYSPGCRRIRSMLAARCASGCGRVSRSSRTTAIFPISTRSFRGTRSTRRTTARFLRLPVGLRWTGSRATSRRRRAGRWHISRRSSLDSATATGPSIASRWLPDIASETTF